MEKHSVLVIEMEHISTFPKDLWRSLSLFNQQKVFLHQVHSNYKTDNQDIVLYHCECLNEDQLNWLLPLAQNNVKSRFLILAQQISIHAYRHVSSMKNLVTLQMPCSEALFQRVIEEVLYGSYDHDRKKFPRFITNEPVRMVVMETGLLIPTRMRNYSMTGAFLEYKGFSLRVGHNLKVNMINQENPPSRTSLQLDAKVVWVREEEGRAGKTNGIGIQFLDMNKAA